MAKLTPMKTFTEFISFSDLTETFDTVYPWHIIRSSPTSTIYKFAVPMPTGIKLAQVEIWVDHGQRESPDHVVTVMFTVGRRMDMPGWGDTVKFGVFSTVIAIIKDYITKYSPKIVRFSAEKEPQDVKSNSRERLYTALVQRFATASGYRVSKLDEPVYRQVVFTLIRK